MKTITILRLFQRFLFNFAAHENGSPMKFKMKACYCIILLLFSLSAVSQVTPPPYGCEDCTEDYNNGVITQQQYIACLQQYNCDSPLLPIGSTTMTVVLLASGIALGFYGMQKKKKA
ncbi:hypothetical protein [Flavobacterium kingsejongi]|uniref:hypothetical protein n=1 Tax=Flavobacterium kingsejongi TaxID=1678728 RepID=UPI00130072E2|nr:hypothetical protein [Flavobacterium kingsejongi]